jgi:AraC family transcriptional activator of mtrCDE
MKAMTTTLLKQVLVKLLRISLKSPNLWVERFSVLGDPQIARAFADMVAQPGRSHSVQALSEKAGLSRSVFMARFTTAFGRSPMAVLRQLRMRHAAVLLKSDHLSIEQISRLAGYASRSSFFKAFQKAYGSDPSNYLQRPIAIPISTHSDEAPSHSPKTYDCHLNLRMKPTSEISLLISMMAAFCTSI